MRNGSGALSWKIVDNASWLSCSPTTGINDGKINVTVNPSGLGAGTYSAEIRVTSPEALFPSQSVAVSLKVAGRDNAPFGVVDTPADGSTVTGSVSISGWALDDIGITRVEIKRSLSPGDPGGAAGSDGLVYVDDAAFIEGARPDVEKAFPGYPLNFRAGWGYMILSNVLPNQGNGTFELHAFACDADGHRVEIGKKSILCNNTNQVKPFGTIDSPKPGESVSGNSYINFAWALTPAPKTIPKDGSTIKVWVDGVDLGHPVYNQYRQDIALRFPEYTNSQGAVGYFYLDTTRYKNGIHTIGWSVVDNQGQADGIGSRFFSIDNYEAGNFIQEVSSLKGLFQEDNSGNLSIRVKEIRRGYGLRPDPETRAGDDGIFEVQLEQMEPGRIVFQGSAGGRRLFYDGWEQDTLKDLPLGSTLDREKGVFSWIPAPGFLGIYRFNFVSTDGLNMSKPVQVVINVIPKR